VVGPYNFDFPGYTQQHLTYFPISLSFGDDPQSYPLSSSVPGPEANDFFQFYMKIATDSKGKPDRKPCFTSAFIAKANTEFDFSTPHPDYIRPTTEYPLLQPRQEHCD